MHILVLGGNGFIGSHFVAQAVHAGHKVSVLSRRHHPVWPHKQNYELRHGGFDDLFKNPAWLNDVDAVCHAAWSTVPKTAAENPVMDVQTNVIGTINLLNLIQQTPSIKHLVFLSSGGAVYGNIHTDSPIHEDQALNPIGAYGIGKLAAEKYCHALSGDLNTTIIRPSNPYGAGQTAYGTIGVISTFVHKIMTGEKATLFGGGTAIRDFLDVRDLARLMLMALEKPNPGTYNCGSGQGTSILEVVSKIEDMIDQKANIEHLAARPFDPNRIVLDIEKAQKAFDWQPQISLDDGIRDLITERKAFTS
jgi:UDP-glucose 4-epimerase